MATHSGVLAWRIPGTGEPDGLPSMGSHRFGHDCSDLAAAVLRKPINKQENPETNPCTYGYLIFYKETRHIMWQR